MAQTASVFHQTCTDSAGQDIVDAFALSDSGVTDMGFADELDEKKHLNIQFDSKPGLTPGTQQTAPAHCRIFSGVNPKNPLGPPTASLFVNVPVAEFGNKPKEFDDPLTQRARDFRKLAGVFGPIGAAPAELARRLAEMLSVVDHKKVTTLHGITKKLKPTAAVERLKNDSLLGWKSGTKSSFMPSNGVKLYTKDDVDSAQMAFSVPLFVKRTTGNIATDLDRLRPGSNLHDFQSRNPDMMPNPRFVLVSPYTNETVHWTVMFKNQQYDSFCVYCAINFSPKGYSISETYDRICAAIFVNHLIVYAIVSTGGQRTIAECAPMSAAQQALVNKIFCDPDSGKADETAGAELDDSDLAAACDSDDSAYESGHPTPAPKRVKITDE
jgi:hypothetical protein